MIGRLSSLRSSPLRRASSVDGGGVSRRASSTRVDDASSPPPSLQRTSASAADIRTSPARALVVVRGAPSPPRTPRAACAACGFAVDGDVERARFHTCACAALASAHESRDARERLVDLLIAASMLDAPTLVACMRALGGDVAAEHAVLRARPELVDELVAAVRRSTLALVDGAWMLDADASDDDASTSSDDDDDDAAASLARRSASPALARGASPRTVASPRAPLLVAADDVFREKPLSERAEASALEHAHAEWRAVVRARTFDVSRGLAPRGVPRCVVEFDALRTLDVSYNRAVRSVRCVGALRSLEVLRARSCALRALPDALARCRRLRELDVGANRVRALAPELDALVALERVDVGTNRLTHFDVATLANAWRALVALSVAANALERLDTARVHARAAPLRIDARAAERVTCTRPLAANVVLVE